MNFRIADTFHKALGKLSAQEQSAAKVTVFDLQQDPSAPALKFHRIDKSKDPNFWSIRVNSDVRIIIHKTKDSFLLCHVAHHDDAYKWAERRRIETHPMTGAAQIVEVRELVEEIAIPHIMPLEPQLLAAADVGQERFLPPLFLKLGSDDLLGIGVPEEWIDDVRSVSDDNFFDIADHIPAEATEALLEYISTGVLRKPSERIEGIDPFDHPDALRRFRIMEDVEELTRALDAPWDQWAVFLHPSQRQMAEQNYGGPARVSGSAGTGKTVVALHRVANLLKATPDAKVLLTTFSSPLANALGRKLALLVGKERGVVPRTTVLPFKGIAKELFTLVCGYDPRPATEDHIKWALQTAADDLGVSEFTIRFLMSEWSKVVDAWQLQTLEAYATVPRLGRKNRMGSKQRERAWPIFEKTRELLNDKGIQTWPQIFAAVTAHYAAQERKPFTHIVVDEAQDLGVPELRMLAAISEPGENGLFFAGDLGQRIFQEPFSWMALGVDVRGRSKTLKVNYRTSHQIREAVDRLLPGVVRDVDGNEEDRRGTVSVFNGPVPEVRTFANQDDEVKAVGLWIYEAIDEGIAPDEIGVFVRSNDELARARAAVKEAGQTVLELSDRVEAPDGRVSIGAMHLAKGLEFRMVVVMACDDEVLPQQARVETVADEIELDEVYETERHLFYVACTRARERLYISGVDPASEFLGDLG